LPKDFLFLTWMMHVQPRFLLSFPSIIYFF
jgi:hypothetical protein